MSAPALPAVFATFRDVVRIHLKQIRKLNQVTTKVPMHTVALLIMVAYEALARYLKPTTMTRVKTEWLFTEWHFERYQLDQSIGAAIFDAVRNGLAHTYSPYPLRVGA